MSQEEYASGEDKRKEYNASQGLVEGSGELAGFSLLPQLGQVCERSLSYSLAYQSYGNEHYSAPVVYAGDSAF